MSETPASTTHQTTKRQWAGFLFLTAILALFWLVVFPQLAQQPDLQAEIEFLDERQIDPSAMFYTDLETIDDTLQEIRTFHQEHPDALW